MVMRYIGRDFRLRHNVKLRVLARGAGLNKDTLVELEKHPTQGVTTTTVARIIRYFKSRDIPCDWGDLLVYEDIAEGEGSDGERDPV